MKLRLFKFQVTNHFQFFISRKYCRFIYFLFLIIITTKTYNLNCIFFYFIDVCLKLHSDCYSLYIKKFKTCKANDKLGTEGEKMTENLNRLTRSLQTVTFIYVTRRFLAYWKYLIHEPQQ